MSPLRLHRHFPVQPLGADGYQEFCAGTIQVKRVLTLEGRSPIVAVEHQRGFQRAFDKHLDGVLARAVRHWGVAYRVIWLGVTGGPAGPSLVRLELVIDGLRPRVRLLFKPGTLPPLWFLAGGAHFALLLKAPKKSADAPFTPSWVLGRTPARRGLRRILRFLEIPTPDRALPARILSPER